MYIQQHLAWRGEKGTFNVFMGGYFDATDFNSGVIGEGTE